MTESLPAKYRVLWQSLRSVLDLFGMIQDRLAPDWITGYADRLMPPVRALQETLDEQGKEDLADETYAVLAQARTQVLQAAERFESARTGPHEMLKAYQSLRPLARADEILYRLVPHFTEISGYFLTRDRASDQSLAQRLLDGASGGPGTVHGISHFNNQRGKRAGYSLYVPEYYSEDRPWPLVVALHGGSGHGADFLWSWLRDARSYGFILAAPTSRGRTWSLESPGIDAVSLNQMLSQISKKYHIDQSRILLNGISDGGTYGMLLSIVPQSPFTHFAPVAAAVHVLMNRAGVVQAPVRDVPVYMVHGAKDWMFPISKAREAASALEAAGANIVYREIADLSHNYPRDENRNIVRWFAPGLSG